MRRVDCYTMLAILLLCLVAKSECFGEAHYVLNFDSLVYVTSGDDYIDCSGIVCERHNDTTAYMHGEFEFKKNIEQGLIVVLILKKETSGKHEVLFSHDICELCKELGNEESDYKSYMKYIGLPDHCPLEAGSYKIHNLVVDMTDFQIKDQQCGPYMAELYLYKSTGESCQNDREMIAVLKVDISIERL